MIPIRPLVAVIAITAALLLLTAPAPASSPIPLGVLQPYQVASPSGEFLFEVNPSARNGAGPCTAILLNPNSKEVIWKRKLPYTFWKACVNDEGFVGGFGFTTGPRGGGLFTETPGQFFVRILDPAGAPLHTELTRRRAAFIYTPVPSADALVFDAQNGRMVIQTSNGSFRSYDLSQGTLTSAVHMSRKGLPDRDGGLHNFYAVPRTPLLLLRLPHWTSKDEKEIPGCAFALMDRTGDLVWTFNHKWTLPENWKEFTSSRVLSLSGIRPAQDADPFGGDDDPFGGDEEENDPFAPSEDADDGKEEKPAPPKPRPVAEFVLYLDRYDHGHRVTFRVMEVGDDEPFTWKVAEIDRKKWNWPMDNDVPKELPRLEGKKLGAFVLRDQNNEPLTQLTDVVLGPREQIYALERGTGVVHVFDRKGIPLHRCQPAQNDRIEPYGSPLSVTHDGNVFVKLKDLIRDNDDSLQQNPKIGHAIQFSPQGTRMKDTLSLKREELGVEWFAQPGSTNFLVTSVLDKLELIRRDQHFTQAANLTRRPDGNWLVDINDIAFAPDGTFAVRTSTPSEEDYPTAFPVPPSHRPAEAISIFEADGKPVRTIDFTSGASFHRIAFDGKRLVATRHYHPPHAFVYVLEATGEPLGVFAVDALADGRARSHGLRPFIVNGGKEILLVDLDSARAFRYAMPAGGAAAKGD